MCQIIIIFCAKCRRKCQKLENFDNSNNFGELLRKLLIEKLNMSFFERLMDTESLLNVVKTSGVFLPFGSF